MKFTVGLLDPRLPVATDVLREILPHGCTLIQANSLGREERLRIIAESNYVVTGDCAVDEAMMNAGSLTGLKAVHKWGVGFDNIAVKAAEALGIRVLRTTGSNAQPVAETALAFMLALSRNVVAGHVGLHQGKWLKGPLGATTGCVRGKTVGLIGIGFIGQALVRLLKPFDCTIYYTNPSQLSAEEEQRMGVEYLDLDDLLAKSDFVTLHCSLNPGTHHIINEHTLRKMKRGAYLINSARGELVDEQALVKALETGHLAGAAVDAYEKEPITESHPFLGLPTMITTPHLGGLDKDAYLVDFARIIDNFVAIESNLQPPKHDVVV